jgi:hypothetical protein
MAGFCFPVVHVANSVAAHQNARSMAVRCQYTDFNTYFRVHAASGCRLQAAARNPQPANRCPAALHAKPLLT